MLVMSQMAGFIIGNLISGFLGDRLGVRIPMLLGRVALLACLLSVLAASLPWQFMAVFFLLGFGISTAYVGDMTMVLEFAPSYRRKFFFAVMSVLVVPGILSASLISAGLQYVPNGFKMACFSSMAGVAASLIFLIFVKDPRKAPQEAHSVQSP